MLAVHILVMDFPIEKPCMYGFVRQFRHVAAGHPAGTVENMNFCASRDFQKEDDCRKADCFVDVV